MNTGIGVKLDNVTWLGAKSVQNVIKVGADFGAYGRHMEFIADGESPDTAWIEFGGEKYDLANKASDVSCATFGFPAALAGIEPGTTVRFWMKSRGGIADGQVYTSKKDVTVIAGDTPVTPHIDRARTDQEGEIDNRLVESLPFSVYGSGFGSEGTVKVSGVDTDSQPKAVEIQSGAIASWSDGEIRVEGEGWEPISAQLDLANPIRIVAVCDSSESNALEATVYA